MSEPTPPTTPHIDDFVPSPFPVGSRIRLIQQPYVTGVVTELTPMGFKYWLDHLVTIGRAAWGQTSQGGEVYCRDRYPHGGFEFEPLPGTHLDTPGSAPTQAAGTYLPNSPIPFPSGAPSAERLEAIRNIAKEGFPLDHSMVVELLEGLAETQNELSKALSTLKRKEGEQTALIAEVASLRVQSNFKEDAEMLTWLEDNLAYPQQGCKDGKPHIFVFRHAIDTESLEPNWTGCLGHGNTYREAIHDAMSNEKLHALI